LKSAADINKSTIITNDFPLPLCLNQHLTFTTSANTLLPLQETIHNNTSINLTQELKNILLAFTRNRMMQMRGILAVMMMTAMRQRMTRGAMMGAGEKPYERRRGMTAQSAKHHSLDQLLSMDSRTLLMRFCYSRHWTLSGHSVSNMDKQQLPGCELFNI